MSVVDEVKERIDIAELVGETVKLRKSGKNYTGFCPFHPNSRTPAFVVFPDSGTWRCFGACNEGGDIFKFVMKREGLDFPEALRRLAERAGVELRPRSPEQDAAEEAHQRLRDALEAAVVFFRHNLVETPAGGPVLDYLRGRNLTDATLEAFEIGYAPNAWGALREHLAARGFQEADLLEAGLLSRSEAGKVFDRFRHRIMFPIRDARARVAGFGARVVDPQDVPKFLNSPQSPLFDKGRLLYGLDRARKAIRAGDQAVIVEGYLDVVALHQAGYANAVSPMGTALSEDQLRLLKRFSRRIVMALDPDVAGDAATLRGLSVARDSLDRQADPVFDARGLVRYEGRLDADIRVAPLPAGRDPDEVVAENPQAWADLVAQAAPVVSYVQDVLTRGRDLDDPKVKAEVAGQVLPLIEDVANPVEREAYRQQLARTLRVDERALLSFRPPDRRHGRRAPAQAPAEAPGGAREGRLAPLEAFCLGAVLHNPELLYRVDRELQALDLERFSGEDFTGTERQVIFHAVRASLGQDDQDPAEFWRTHLEAPVLEASLALAEAVAAPLAERPRADEEVVASFLRLRLRSLGQRLTQLQFQQLAAQEAGDMQAARDLGREVARLTRQREPLDRALARGRLITFGNPA